MRPLLLSLLFAVVASMSAQDVGTMIFAPFPKVKYMGQMADNGKDRTGTGIQLLKGNNVYIGDVARSKKNGLGMEIVGHEGKIDNAPGAMVYVGNWLNGRKEGRGTAYGPDGEIIYAGMWAEDVPVGGYPTPAPDASRYYSTLDLPGQEYYIGEVTAGKPDGFGMYILADGQYAVTRSRNGVRTGVALVCTGPTDWAIVKWDTDPTRFSTITNSAQYASRKAVYNEVHSREMAQFRQGMTEVMTGLAKTAADFQVSQNGGTVSMSSSSSSSIPSSSATKNGTAPRHDSAKKSNDCGSAWMSASRVYSDYETQLIPNGSRSADISDHKDIRRKMKDIRLKWEARGCKINKSPYE